jgi:microcystin-dependent protein
MADPFMGEVKILAFNFAPKGWALCNGQTLNISQNSALFALLGTQYGGNGTTTFGLPNLQDRVAIHRGQGTGLSNYAQGQTGGGSTVTLTTNNIPSHTHTLAVVANTAATTGSPAGATFAGSNATIGNVYSGAGAATGSAVALPSQGGAAHSNEQPYLALNFCIATVGVFPSRN